MIYRKQCPTCNKEIIYSCNKSLCNAIKRNSNCKKCSAIKKGPRDEATKRKISQTLAGRTIPRDIVDKITKTLKEQFNTPEYKRKFSDLHKGEKNGMYNKHHDEKMCKEISKLTSEAMKVDDVRTRFLESHRTNEYRSKISKIHKGKVISDKTKQKMREGVVRRVLKYGIRARNFNPHACKIIDEYGKQNGYNFQHALNGGEFHIKGLGYLVDGYDKEKNVVLEIDEKNHFDIYGRLKEKDVQRQKEIEEHLNCKFIRIPLTEEKRCTT